MNKMKRNKFLKIFILLTILVNLNSLLFPSGYIFNDILLNLKEKFESLKNYQCTFESFTSDGKKTELNVFKYFFSKPKLIRMQIIKGKRESAVLLFDSNDNKIKLRLNKGLFPYITFTFNPNSKMISDLRGLNIAHSDWGWFIDRHMENLDAFKTNFIGEEIKDGKELLLFELISKNIDKTQNIKREKIWIDKKENIINKYQMYDESGVLVQASSYRDIILNPGINEILFYDLSEQ